VKEGCASFLKQELVFCCIWVVIFMLFLVFFSEETLGEFWITVPFLLGSFTSITINFATVFLSNHAISRIAVESSKGITYAFETTMRASTMLSFSVIGIQMFVLLTLIIIYKEWFLSDKPSYNEYLKMFENLLGFGFGSASVSVLT